MRGLLGQANLKEREREISKPKDGINMKKLGGIEGQPPGSSAESDLKVS